MTTWHEYMQQGGAVPEWPYPINYGKVNEVTSDVLVLGGGVAGCRAAISAAKNGAKTVLAERGHAKRSGGGGAGVDHWHGAAPTPAPGLPPKSIPRQYMIVPTGGSAGMLAILLPRKAGTPFLN